MPEKENIEPQKIKKDVIITQLKNTDVVFTNFDSMLKSKAENEIEKMSYFEFLMYLQERAKNLMSAIPKKDEKENIEPQSCPDPDKIKSCQECVQKKLANCGWAEEQEYKKEKEYKKEVDIALLF